MWAGKRGGWPKFLTISTGICILQLLKLCCCFMIMSSHLLVRLAISGAWTLERSTRAASLLSLDRDQFTQVLGSAVFTLGAFSTDGSGLSISAEWLRGQRAG
ncbi:hypothetical protein GOP47_0010881 [Adiantum capillus-veneris]|uniref:Uncharacterized protein n=1 Tax=Adiantum capillus-veneris TaxID=13818 RepID=A0A9D4ZJ82_ADICA|nr:hypothetical protein GOP47_0010881 [Adiantum capillus-veneris]